MSFLSESISYPLISLASVLTQQPGANDPGGQGEDFGKSSPLGLLILVLFLIAVVFLVRSMTKHLKRVPASFDKADEVVDGEVGNDGVVEKDVAEKNATGNNSEKAIVSTASAGDNGSADRAG